MTESKACRGCGKVKPLDEYARKPKLRDGRAARCKKCLAEWAAEYRRTSSDVINANARRGYSTDPTKKRASKSAYRQRHGDTLRERSRKQYRETYKVDPSPWHAARARRKSRSTARMSREDRVLSRAYRAAIRLDPCHYCGETIPGDMHDDHYYPLAKGGTDHWWNLVRACGPCNRRKHTYCGTWFLLRGGFTSGTARSVPALPEAG